MREKIIVIPDSFKGSMSSEDVARVISDAAARLSGKSVVSLPIADGGEGSMDCIMRVLGGKVSSALVTSPEGKPIPARYGVTPDGTAILEFAESSGITKQTGYDALNATSYGFGELIRTALEDGARKFTLCLGGSATTDCGCGMAAALGAEFYNEKHERFIPTGGTLIEIADISVANMDERIRASSFTVMSDVESPLCGSAGAACIFAPQKGAMPEQVKHLDKGLAHAGRLIRECTSVPFESLKGAGAAGGAAYGCCAFLAANITSGIEAMLDIYHFDELLEDCCLIVTGEGKLDSQSLMGKVLSGIRAHSGKLPVVAFCGLCEADREALDSRNITVVEIGRGIPLEESIAEGKKYLKQAAEAYFKGGIL